ncbi:MAG: transporter substrate-binding domain-containing protein, partial [Vulcanimicrobiaceae bacterium]
METGGYEGLDIDVARAFAKSLGVRAEFVQTSWPTMTADLLADKFDLAMGGISQLPARAEVGLLSHGYLSDGKRPLIRKADQNRFHTLADIDQPGVRVAVNPGGTNQKFDAANLSHATVDVVEKNLSIPALIADGKADVFITDGVEADYDASRDSRLLAVDPSHPYTHDTKVYFLQRDEASVEQALDGFI